MEFSSGCQSSLQDERVRIVLDRLHTEARADKFKILGIVPGLIAGWIKGKSFEQIITPERLRNIYMSVSRDQGQFMYQTARAIGAKRIVEFGTSFGVSMIYLAAAVRDNGGEIVIGTELESHKHEQAVKNVSEAGLDGVAEIRLGDALETIKVTPEPLDVVLLDGLKQLYMPILEMLKPRLRVGSIVFADNIYNFKKSLRPYVEYMQSGRNGFESVILPFSDGFEYSVYVGEKGDKF